MAQDPLKVDGYYFVLALQALFTLAAIVTSLGFMEQYQTVALNLVAVGLIISSVLTLRRRRQR